MTSRPVAGLFLLAVLAACDAPEAPAAPGTPTSTEPPPPPPSTIPTDSATPPEPEPEPDPGAWLFDDTLFHIVDIEIDEEAIVDLLEAPREWTHGDLTINGVHVDDVGVRLKGNASFRPLGGKSSWRIKLDRWVPDQELDGLDDLTLNNMVSDPTGMHERLTYRLFRAAGVPAPRAVHVRVRVNGLDQGVYTMVEHTDKRFLRRHYEDEDGPLYEIFDADFFVDQVPLFEHESGPDDRIAPMVVATLLDDEGILISEEPTTYLDLDAFTRYWATAAVAAHFDAYPYSFPGDDIHIYVDPSDGRFDFIPHGADETLTDGFRPADYVFGRLALRCLDDPSCEAAWQADVWDVVDVLESIDLAGRAEQLRDELEPELATDPLIPWTTQEIAEAQDQLVIFLANRRTRLSEMPGLQ